MNRLAGGAAIRSGRGRISSEIEKKHRTFKEMIQCRKEREQKDRLVRNKVNYRHVIVTGFLLSYPASRN